MIKDLILLLKAFLEWKLPLDKHQHKVASLTVDLIAIKDWLEADPILMNNFVNLLRVVMSMEIGGVQLTKQNSVTMPIVKQLLDKIKLLSNKPPHTETNMALVRNALQWLMACAQFADVRCVFRRENVFAVFDNFCPHLHPSRKSTFDNVTLEWLRFFEFISRFEDLDCKPQ